MALVMEKIYKSYDYYFNISKDPRSENWYLLETPPTSILLIMIGFVIVTKHGPKFMEMRKPYELKFIMMIYNFIQVVLNLSIGIYGTYYFFIKHKFNWKCQNVNYSTDEYGMLELRLSYYYFLLKVLDLADSLFIVMKKKNSQLTFLHCYHHFCMALGCYVAAKWLPGGHGLLLGMINLYVHGLMYFYYFLTSFKPELKQSIWWKKHITQVQLIQFAILAVCFLRACFSDSCSYPKFWLWVLVIQNTYMFAMFADFYRRAYFKRANVHKIQ